MKDKKPPPIEYDATEWWKEKLFKGAPRPLRERKKDIDQKVDEMTSLKERQDDMAGIKRRYS